MNIIRLLINWFIILSTPIWLPLLALIILFNERRTDNFKEFFLKGKKWIWDISGTL